MCRLPFRCVGRDGTKRRCRVHRAAAGRSDLRVVHREVLEIRRIARDAACVALLAVAFAARTFVPTPHDVVSTLFIAGDTLFATYSARLFHRTRLSPELGGKWR